MTMYNYFVQRMTSKTNGEILSGILDCFKHFSGTYCYRKTIQFAGSSLLVITSLVLMGLIIKKHRFQKHLIILIIVLFMTLCLTANILFCLFNQHYWLYALQAFFYNLYYLGIVAYVCRAYVFKYRQNSMIMLTKHFLENNNATGIKKQRIIFYSVLTSVTIMYTIIFITSLVSDIGPQIASDASTIKYCQEIWYLCFEGFCILLSIILLFFMFKNYQEEKTKLIQFQQIFRRKSVQSAISKDSASSNEKRISQQYKNNIINNPLQQLWIWIILNVASQITNMVQSGLFLQATPPQCLIIKANQNASNIWQIFFVFLTMYLGFIVTIWYVSTAILSKNKVEIDRSVLFTDQIRRNCNIQMAVPSRTISLI